MNVMNRLLLFALVAVGMCGVLPASAAEVDAPALSRGAVITISDGQISKRDAITYRRKHGKSPEPVNLTMTVREVLDIDGISCYMDACTLRPTTTDGFAKTLVVAYCTQGSRAELLLNAVKNDGGTEHPYYLRQRANYDPMHLARGGGSGIALRFSRRDGEHTWHGAAFGVLYCPTQKLCYQFNNAPVVMTLPPEGEQIPDPVAPAEPVCEPTPPSAEPDSGTAAVPDVPITTPSPGEPAGATLPAFDLQDIIRKRMQMMIGKPVDVALMESFYAEKVTNLKDGKVKNRRDIIAATERMVGEWPRRGVYLLDAGYDGQRLEILVVFSFSNDKMKDHSQYCKITLDFDADGKVNAMSEQFADSKHSLTPGFVPVKYTGEKTLITIE